MANALSTTLAGLRGLPAPDPNTVYQTTDFGGGQWYYDPLDISLDNTGTIVKCASTGAVFKRIYTGALNVKWFGAKGDDSINDVLFINNCISTAGSLGVRPIIIPEGIYLIDVSSTGIGIIMASNVDVLNEGTLKVIPNSRDGYDIVSFNGVSDSSFSGGTIQGDKLTHTGSTGEFGMGISIKNSCNHIKINNLTVTECWGDGLYIGGTQNTNLDVFGLVSDNNRRQGMSITNVKGLVVTNSYFTATSGANPQAGIDLEPNSGQIVEEVSLTNIFCLNNTGAGIDLYNENGTLRNINISNLISKSNKVGLRLHRCSNISVYGSCLNNNEVFGLEIPRDIDNVTFYRTEFNFNNSHGASIITSSQTTGIKRLIFHESQFNNNSQATAGISDGVRIDKVDSTGITKFVKFYDCDFSDNQNTHTQRYGISIKITADPTISEISIHNGTYTGNLTGSRSGTDLQIIADTQRAITRSGSSANRPTTNTIAGDLYFDTTLSKWVGWDGNGWLNVIPNADLIYFGLVKKSVAVADVSTNDAQQTAVPNATDLATALSLLNDLKAKYNQAVTLTNENKTRINSKLAADKLSGQQTG